MFNLGFNSIRYCTNLVPGAIRSRIKLGLRFYWGSDHIVKNMGHVTTNLKQPITSEVPGWRWQGLQRGNQIFLFHLCKARTVILRPDSFIAIVHLQKFQAFCFLDCRSKWIAVWACAVRIPNMALSQNILHVNQNGFFLICTHGILLEENNFCTVMKRKLCLFFHRWNIFMNTLLWGENHFIIWSHTFLCKVLTHRALLLASAYMKYKSDAWNFWRCASYKFSKQQLIYLKISYFEIFQLLFWKLQPMSGPTMIGPDLVKTQEH